MDDRPPEADARERGTSGARRGAASAGAGARSRRSTAGATRSRSASQSGSATNGRKSGKPGRARGGRARHREHEQRRRPLREHDVLEQVRPEERVHRERLERPRERGEDQRERRRGGGHLSPRRPFRAGRERVRERDRRHERDSLGRGMHPATLAARGCSSMVELQPSKLAMRVRFPPPALSDSCTKSPGFAAYREEARRRVPEEENGQRSRPVRGNPPPSGLSLMSPRSPGESIYLRRQAAGQACDEGGLPSRVYVP